MKKKTVAVLFGGQSTEHEISCLSAVTIIQNIDREQYDLLLIGITRDGRWLKTNSIEEIQSGRGERQGRSFRRMPDIKVCFF